MPSEQVSIDFDYDDRVPGLARELAIVLAPHLPPGTPSETVRTLAARAATLAAKRLRDAAETSESLRCHLCDVLTAPDNRARIAVCVRCALEPRSPGASG